jgi:pimeloyl-ACP methyl ester carboxylesterase
VGGYTLRYKCYGQGTPAVIVEAGLGDPPIITRHWTKVTQEIQKTTRICIYDRAGIGTSDKAPIPRTSKDMAQDLHKLLINAHIGGPYILVGHSIGGFIVRVYASQYPEEIVGMVLVDSSHPDQFPKFMAAFPPETLDEPASVKNLRQAISMPSNDEGMDIAASAAQVRATNSLGNMPLLVITRSPTWDHSPTLPVDFAAKLEHIWQDMQIDLLSISSNSTHIIASKAGHNIEFEEPKLVIDAILKVIGEVLQK